VIRLTEEIKTVQVGLGAMGAGIARLMLRRKGLRVVGAVDTLDSMIGKDLGDVIKAGKNVGVSVSNSLDAVLAATQPDVVLFATVGVLEKIYPQIVPAINAGADVISTCEDLAYPFRRQPQLAKRIDVDAKDHGATVLGTGSIPGFGFDTFIILLCSVCEDVTKIEATRTTDYSVYGEESLRRWGIGLTLTADQYKAALASRKLQVLEPIMDSLFMVADSLGWELDDTKLTAEPIISKRTGKVSGFRQRTFGIRQSKELIVLNYACSISPKDDKLEINDSYSIQGTSNINLVIRGGLEGGAVTVSNMVNMIPHVLNAEPGLKTMKDLMIPRSTWGDMASLCKHGI